MSKRIQSILIMCIVILMALCPFLFVSAIEYIGKPYSQPYMPVCSLYPTSNTLPFGEDTFCVYYNQTQSSNYIYWWFVDTDGFYTISQLSPSGTITVNRPIFGFFCDDKGISSVYYRLVFYSSSKIVQVRYNKSTDTFETSYLGTRDTSSQTANQVRFKALINSVISASPLQSIVCTDSYSYEGSSIDYWISEDPSGWGADLYKDNYYIAQYPDTVKQAIDSISDNSALLSQYYTSLNSKLNSLSIDVQYVQGQNDELSSKVDELQRQLASQNSEYQTALDEAQSEIESNVQSAAQSAADGINNAGEDVSDLNDDMSDVNGIVETLHGWVERLDTFSDTLDDTAVDVADALDNASDFVQSFFSACPAIVIALFSFALVFLVVRKVIGR